MARTDESTRSAHETLRKQFERAESLQRLVAEYEDALTIAHDQQIRGALEDVLSEHGVDVERVREDPAYGALARRLAARAEQGADLREDLRRVVDARELGSADSVPKVLTYRLERMNVDESAQGPVGQPEGVSPGLAGWLRDRQGRIEGRKDDLVRDARQDPPAWLRTLQIGGRRLDDETLRQVVAYRDRHGVTDTVKAAGIEPDRHSAQHQEWKDLTAQLQNVQPSREPAAEDGLHTLVQRARRRPGPADPEPPKPEQRPDLGRDVD